METVFSSAFLLYVIDAVSPGFVPDQTWLATAHSIFDMMIAKGSPAAPLRKRELQRLEQIMTSYLAGLQMDSSTLQLQSNAGLGSPMGDRSRVADTEYMDSDSPWGLLGAQGGLIMSPGEILQLAGELQMDDFILDP